MNRLVATIAAGLLLVTAGAAWAEPRVLTLAEAVALAERNAPGAVQAAGQSRNAAAAVRSAQAAFLPGVSVSAGASRQLPSGGSTRVENGQVITVASEPWSSSLGVSANLELFDGGQRFFELAQARARRASAAAGEITSLGAVRLAAEQAYFDVLAARETQVAVRAQLEQAEQQRVVAVAKSRAKTATRSDSLRAEIQVRSAQLATTQAATALASANASLGRAVGVLEPVTASEADSVDAAELAVPDSVLAAMAEDAPAVRAARADLDAARAARRSAWTAYLPSVGASWSRSGSGTGGSPAWGAGDLDYAGSVRFSLSFPVFDQLQREQGTTQAKVAARNAEVALRDARLAARESFVQALGGFRAGTESVQSQSATVAAAEEDLRVQRERYAVGGSTLLDVLTSQTQLDQARRDLIRARYDQRVTRAQLEALFGRNL